MSELQMGLLTIGALVVAGVLTYNKIQERGAKRGAERAFRSGHADVLLGAATTERKSLDEPYRVSAIPRASPATEPDPAIDYIVEFASDQPGAQATVQEQWAAIQRRHAPRVVLAMAPDGKSWRAGLQLVSRDGSVGEADLIEFRSAVETVAASVGTTVIAPEMRAAMESARALDAFCADADIQVVVHVQGGPFTGNKVRDAAEANGLAFDEDGKLALRNGDGRLLYTLAAREGAPLAAATIDSATPAALTLALDFARTPDTRRSFESMARLAHHLAAALGGRIVDDNGNPLDDRAVAAIAQQLDAVRAQLESRGVPPGGAAALRLFS